MNKLECTLTELNTMVEWGCRWLSDHKEIDIHTLRDLANRHPMDEIFYADDIVEYVQNNYYINDVYSDEEIGDYAYDHLDMVDKEQALDYVKENYDVEDVFDTDEMLENISESTIKDYVINNFNVEDLVEWSC